MSLYSRSNQYSKLQQEFHMNSFLFVDQKLGLLKQWYKLGSKMHMLVHVLKNSMAYSFPIIVSFA